MRYLLLLVLLVECATAKHPPNIVLFVADDLGFETVGCYGGESYRTPEIDRLAAEGLRFASCLSTPMCAPSRAMMMSGFYSFRNYDTWAYLDDHAPAIADHLGSAGYVTGMAGKWHLGNWEPDAGGARGPARFGFDTYLSCEVDKEDRKSVANPGAGNAHWKTVLIRDGVDELPPKVRHSEEGYVEFAREFFRSNRERPFFFHYASYLAHRPFVRVENPGPADFGRSGDAANFPAMVERLDAIVGELRSELTSLGIADDTVFLFTSDNGTDNVHDAKPLRSVWRGRELRGGKYYVNELGTAVPFIAVWPGTIAPGTTTRAPIDFTDLLPTALAIARIAPEPASDGHSLLPIFTGEAVSVRDVACTWGTLDGSNRVYHRPVERAEEILHAVRDARWRYLSNGHLYDTVADPLMRSPVKPGTSSTADAARARLAEALAGLRATGPRIW